MNAWAYLWLAWILLFLAIELPAARREGPGTVRTLSRHVWARWAPRQWQRAFFMLFGFEVFVLHFGDASRHWWSGGWAVALTGLPVGVLITWREREMLKKVLSKLKVVGSWVKGGGSWVLRRGPLWSSLLTGAAIAFPAAGPVLQAVAGALGIISGAPGVTDPEVVKAFGALCAGGMLVLGALRKFLKLARPLLTAK